jgi:hypothetical protein
MAPASGPPPLQPTDRGEKVITTIRIPKELAAKIAKYAKAHRATQGEAIRHLLQWATDQLSDK